MKIGFIFTLIFLFSAGFIFSQSTLLQRNIRWDSNSHFENANIFDTIQKLYYFNEIVDLPQNLNLRLEFLDWDTVPFPGENFNLLSSEFTHRLEVKQINGKYRYNYLIKPYCSTKDSSRVLRLKSYRIIIEKTNKQLSYTINNSVLSSGKWHKIKVLKNGIYKLSYAQIKKLGFSDPSNVSLFGYAMGMLPKSTLEIAIDDLKKIPVRVDGSNMYFYGNGANDLLYDSTKDMFYHQVNKYSDTTYYYLTDAYGAPDVIDNLNYSPTNPVEINSFDDVAFYENDEISILRTGSEWYSDRMSPNQQTSLNLSFPNIDANYPVRIYYDFLSKSGIVADFVVKANSTQEIVNIFPKHNYASPELSGASKSGSFLLNTTNSTIKISVQYKNSDNLAEGYINYIGAHAKRKLEYNGGQFIIRNKEYLNSGKDLKYVINNVPSNENFLVWDVTDINKPHNVSFEKSGENLIFYSSSSTINTYIIFNSNSGYQEPIIDQESQIALSNQNIHGADIPDLIIVAPDSLAIYEQAKRLAQFREQNDGLKVLLVKISEVYNEFSAGRRDVTAVRNMIKYFYDKGLTADRKLKYLLLFGDGTYVNKKDLPNNKNLLPTYESDESFDTDNSYVTDDYFGWMTYNDSQEENFILNIGIGRLPVKNYSEASDVVNKVISYSNPSNDDDWRNILCFIADDGDNNLHLTDADEIAENVRKNYPYFNVQKIYLDAYTQVKSSNGESYPDAFESINNRVNSGALIINYTGHGNERQLTNETVINLKSIRSWHNKQRLPLFLTATCEFSRWDDYNYSEKKTFTSAGEEVLLNPDGGAVALLSTTRLVYATENAHLNNAFYKYVFKKDGNGNYSRLGDIFRLTKNDPIARGVNRLNFSLLGDPTLMLGCPKKIEIKTDSVNKVKVTDTQVISDTVKALSKVKISGYFDKSGDIDTYNGILSVNILDKPDTLYTLANDDDSQEFKFIKQDATIYKGLVNVVNGRFSFEFPVPLDIKYNLGNGKIVYYSPSISGSYAGYFDNILIGGIASNTENNLEGPEINLFMNDTNFRDGGITNSNPKLLVHLQDPDGINASGIGIGHDINAILDDNFSQMFSLNFNYRTEINNYKRGSTNYSFNNLSPGLHTVKVVAWDIFNNSIEKEIKFKVIENENIQLNRLVNYPNPMKDYTYFAVEHNKPDSEIKIQIYIYTFTGSLVNVLKYEGLASGFRTTPLMWNGMDASGHRAGTGVYPYKLVFTDENGSSSQAIGKLVIIN